METLALKGKITCEPGSFAAKAVERSKAGPRAVPPFAFNLAKVFKNYNRNKK